MERCSGKIPIRNRRDEKSSKAPRFSVSKKLDFTPCQVIRCLSFIVVSNVIKIPPGCDMSSHRFSLLAEICQIHGVSNIFLAENFCADLCGTPNGDYKMGLYRCLLRQAVSRKAASRHLRPISPSDQLVSGRCQAREKTKKHVPTQIPQNPVSA